MKDEIAPHRFLDELLATEIRFREERRVKTSLRLSALPPGQTLANFDWTFQPDIDRRRVDTLATCSGSLFFRLVSWRYQKGSTLITTNKAVKDWPEVFAGDDVMVTALLDRLLHRCHVFNIKGRSYRLRELEQQMNS